MENTQENEVVTVDNEPTPNDNEKTFNQEQVNAFIQNRLSSIYGGYGVKDKTELDALVEKAKSFDDFKSKYDSLENEHSKTVEKLTFIENNVNPERYDDVRAYFKGKELVFNADNLIKELETHKEWLKVEPVTTIKVGNIKTEQPKATEKEQASKLFGLKL
jgi:hypothetical protein